MAQFQALEEFLDDTLQLPVAGKTYIIKAPDAETGLLVEKLFAAGFVAASGGTPKMPTVLRDADEDDMYRRLLRSVYDELLADGVSHLALKHVGTTAMIWTVFGLEAAEKYWTSGGRPEAHSPANRAARRATKSAATATASRTRKPASTTTTTTSPTTSGSATPATRSRGRKS